jgi:hypothetical protein
MSEPTRYRVANNQAQLTLGGNILAVDPAGPLVMYDDYARLKAEVERLTKAGDRVLHVLLWTDEYDEFRYKDAKKVWDDAKGVKS